MKHPPRSIFRSRRNRKSAAYLPEVIRRGLKQTPGTIMVAEVQHAAECPFPRGKGPCTCGPDDIEVRLRPLHDPQRN
jgi:hypothetical protein